VIAQSGRTPMCSMILLCSIVIEVLCFYVTCRVMMSGVIVLMKKELRLLVYELIRSGLLAENEIIRPILAQLEKLLLCDLSPSTNDSVKNRSEERRVGKECRSRGSQ